MELLNPNWNQQKPPWQAAQAMCKEIALEPLTIQSEAISKILERLRVTHSNGGAFIATFKIAENEVFDWFASRNRILEYDILSRLLRREEVRSQLSEISISDAFAGNVAEACSITNSDGFSFDNPFLLDGQLAQHLFAGGAYPYATKIDGKTAMQLAADYCEAIFNRRYEDVRLYTSYEAWSPWFFGIAWDWSSIVFDRRNRTFWILVVTGTD